MKKLVHRNIATLRKRKNITQPELAEGVSMPLITIKAYEGGLRIPRFAQAERLCKFFAVTTHDLFHTDLAKHQPTNSNDVDALRAEVKRLQRELEMANRKIKLFKVKR